MMKTITDIKEYIDIFENSVLTSLEIEMEGLTLKMTKEGTRPLLSSQAEAQILAPEEPKGVVVKSPLVGTYYSSAAPDQRPFVKPGDLITKGMTLGIVEAMKTMNEIKAPISGVIKKIHVQNGDVVGFDQALVTIDYNA
ncbi:MAG: biotin/lipoyl-containing protein [Candidatus Izemoplasmatales bacterium]|jgi:acetyl-CoA carboxylase biotin carboxyl carrier protein